MGANCLVISVLWLTPLKPFFKQRTSLCLANRSTLVWCKRPERLVMARALQVRFMQSFSCHCCPFVCCCLDDLLCRPSTYRQQVTYRHAQAKSRAEGDRRSLHGFLQGQGLQNTRNVCANLLQSFGRQVNFEIGLYKLYQASIDQVTWHTLHSWHRCAHFPEYCMPLQRHLQDAWHLVAEATLDLAEWRKAREHVLEPDYQALLTQMAEQCQPLYQKYSL